jgi:hypothetical protein
MAPTLNIGDLVVFEYHRSPRRDGEIVIANLPEFGPATDGTEAIKRITQDATHWIFQSDNPAYGPKSVAQNEIGHPILGIMVEVIPPNWRQMLIRRRPPDGRRPRTPSPRRSGFTPRFLCRGSPENEDHHKPHVTRPWPISS